MTQLPRRFPPSKLIRSVCSYGLPLGVLATLVWYSILLSQSRIYQVDECQNVYMTRVLATGQSSEFFTNSSLFLLGPLSWLAQKAARSAELFASARLLFLGIFWLNLLLLALIVGGRIASVRGLIALTAAATLAPLWDYGFEIRHDNVMLTGILLTWWVVRVKPMQTLSYLLAGAITIILLFTAVKTVVYAVPLCFVILVFPPPNYKRPRWQLCLLLAGGAMLAAAVIRLCYGTGDAWNDYLSIFRRVTQNSAGADTTSRFWPWTTLGRLFGQTPLLLALTVAGCSAVLTDLARRGKSALTWEGFLPEFLLLSGALAALMVNPTPFPYNLFHVVPYAFILAFKYGDALWSEFRKRTHLWPLVGTMLLFAHLFPFGLASLRHLGQKNARQNQLMRLAEELTHPRKDPVYDAIGMVPTRPSIHFQWYLHSLNIRGMVKNPGSRLRDLLAARPAAVFIPSYRTEWLPPEDHDSIAERYVPLADDFWVLGTVLPAGGGDFEVFHPGRYQIVKLKPPLLPGGEAHVTGKALAWEDDLSIAGTLDGKTLSKQPVELSVGAHRIETTADCQPAVVWVGPRLDNVPRLSPGNHLTLFRNWY